jgi:hypothetical protein
VSDFERKIGFGKITLAVHMPTNACENYVLRMVRIHIMVFDAPSGFAEALIPDGCYWSEQTAI